MHVMKSLRCRSGHAAVALLAVVAFVLGLAGPAGAATMRSLCNVPLVMSDGTVLRANLWLPGTTGSYPTVLTVTGYNKDSTNPTGMSCTGSGGIATADTSLTGKGYAVMLVDDRGTGASEGTWDSWGSRTQQDYQDILDWIQAQPWSDGHVATTGASYMGITSLLVAEADAVRVREGKPRAVEAVWADVPMADAYRDVTFQGGATDSGFIPLWLGLTTTLSDIPPSTTLSDPGQSLLTYEQHMAGNSSFAAGTLLSAVQGAQYAYDGPFYQLRSPVLRAASIRVPVVIQGGWYDLFQRGEPLLFTSLTHSPHKMLFMSPHYHITSGPAMEDPNITDEFFDHWLKGVDNGIQKRPAINLYPINGNGWIHPKSWPLPHTHYTPLYLSSDASGSSAVSEHDGSLTAQSPTGSQTESEPLLPVSSPCSRITAQWTAGATAGTPCETDNRTFEATSLTYTTQPLKQATQLAGFIKANVWATLSNASDATLIAVLSEVNASGASSQITAGYLLASQRAVDVKRSTRTRSGLIIRPWHPYTQASQTPVPSGTPEQYQIEIYPSSIDLPAGDRLRLTIATADTPSTFTPIPDLLNEIGGQLTILNDPTHPSSLLLPLTQGSLA
jgi:putative CocE/NonD family hydrolase